MTKYIAVAVLVLAATAALCTTDARADTITFNTAPPGAPVGLNVEGNFVYSTFSGGLFRDSQGNGDLFNMEGWSSAPGGPGGILTVSRNDVAGGLFTFDGSDVAHQFQQAYGITFRGYLGGALQGTDVFLADALSTGGATSFTTYASAVLAGVVIDELRVQLDATGGTATVIDNLQFTRAPTVPEPTTLALFGLGAGALALRRRRGRKTA